jgi:hypothetical protein
MLNHDYSPPNQPVFCLPAPSAGVGGRGCGREWEETKMKKDPKKKKKKKNVLLHKTYLTSFHQIKIFALFTPLSTHLHSV